MRKLLLAGVAAAVMPLAANAVPFNGSFAIEASGQERIEAGDVLTGIDFSGVDDAAVGSDDQIFGNFNEIISEGDLVTFEDLLNFDASSGYSYTVFGDSELVFTITDESISPTIAGGENFETVVFNASGVFSAAGYDNTPGILVYTGQQADQSFSFSTSQATRATPVIPVPAALPLLAGALGGFGFFALRRKRA